MTTPHAYPLTNRVSLAELDQLTPLLRLEGSLLEGAIVITLMTVVIARLAPARLVPAPVAGTIPGRTAVDHRQDHRLLAVSSATRHRSLTPSLPATGGPDDTRASTPRILAAVERMKSYAVVIGAHRVTALLRRPRFLRGPSTEAPLDASVISTPRLTLRPYSMTDAARWYELQSDPDVVRYLPWPIRTREASRVHLHDRTRHTRVWQSDDLLALGIECGGTLIGDVSLQLRTVTPEVRTVEMGWIIDPRHGGHGYATEASLAMVQIAFNTVRAKIITAVIHTANDRSLALAARLGFRETNREDGMVLMTLSTIDFLDTLAHRPELRDILTPLGPAPIRKD